MSYDVVSIPAGTNQFFLAYCLSYLLPTIHNESSFKLFSGWFPEQQIVIYAPSLSARPDEHVVSITSSASEQIVMNAFSLYRSSADIGEPVVYQCNLSDVRAQL